jgi:hypothetical protein
MQSIIEHFRVVTCVNQKCLDALKCLLAENGFRIFELDGASIGDKISLFVKAGEHLPHENGLIARNSWDALIDTLWGGLAELNAERVAFIWTHAEKMLEHSLTDMLIANDCFQHLASEVATTEHGFPHPMLLKIFLVGVGENFPALAT